MTEICLLISISIFIYANNIYALFLGMEVFYQIFLQIILLLLANTKTATTSGLQTYFEEKQNTILGLDSSIILVFSIASCIAGFLYGFVFSPVYSLLCLAYLPFLFLVMGGFGFVV